MKALIKQIKVDRTTKLRKRAREDFGDIACLAESLKDHGLIHPIVVSKIEEGDYHYLLVAGERRLRAAILAGFDEVDIRIFSDIDPFERKAIELEENLQRQNLGWPEEVEGLRQLHELRQQIYGPATRSKDSDGWGIRETAAAIGRSVGQTSDDLKLANALRDRHDIVNRVGKLPKRAAIKIVKQIIEAERLRHLVDSKGIDIGVELIHGDCLTLIDDIPDNSIDCLLTDPPFGNPGIVKVGVSHVASYNVTESNVSTLEVLLPLFQKLAPKLAKKLKRGAHVYIFCGMGEAYCGLMTILRVNGFLMDDLPLIWYKERASVIAKDFRYLSSYQACLFGHNQERIRALWKPVKNVISVQTIAPQVKVHPMQIADDVLRLFIENSTSPGHLVLDCFAGSGATLKVARDLQRKSIGFELDEGNYLRAKNWLEETLDDTKGQEKTEESRPAGSEEQ